MERGAVVVTGASTGIGEATARHLHSLGFEVFAGVRKDEDAERMRDAGFRPLKLDVTDRGSIEAARGEVGGVPLAGLVNNAGIAVSAPLEFVPVGELRRQLEVNVVGQVAVTQVFLDALRRHRGRVVMISSIGGRVALPLLGPYAASKFALEALSDSLRREVRRFGIEVSVVEPGGIKTPIWQKGNATADQLMDEAPPELDELYGDLVRSIRRESAKIERERGLPPSAVAEAVGHALTAKKPRTRYLVGRDAKLRAAAAKRLPDRGGLADRAGPAGLTGARPLQSSEDPRYGPDAGAGRPRAMPRLRRARRAGARSTPGAARARERACPGAGTRAASPAP